MKGVTGGGLPALIWRDGLTEAQAGRSPHYLPGTEPEREDFIGRFLDVFSKS